MHTPSGSPISLTTPCTHVSQVYRMDDVFVSHFSCLRQISNERLHLLKVTLNMWLHFALAWFNNLGASCNIIVVGVVESGH